MLDGWLTPRVGRFTPEKSAGTRCRRSWKSFSNFILVHIIRLQTSFL